jgi:hypothetical protein
MQRYGDNDPDLGAWLDALTLAGSSRIVDLCGLAREYYFHPSMKGSLSIKHVLPAVWTANRSLQTTPAFVKYVKRDDQGHLLGPYAALPPLPIGEKEEVINEGTGAMRVYQEMMFGRDKSDDILFKNYRRLLLQYCELDTAAMLMVWMHWTSQAPKYGVAGL